jgi:hypothetical protein
VIVYTLGSAVIPVWAWLLTAISRLPNPHARAWSKPRPHRLFVYGRHARYVGRHRILRTLTGVTV